MSRYLVDTNVVSLIVKQMLGRLKGDAQREMADWFLSQMQDSPTILSFATVAELKRWVVSKEDPADRKKTSLAIGIFFRSSHYIHSNDRILDAWALLAQEARRRGRLAFGGPNNSQINDIWIAATAYACGFTLLTCDKGFDWMAELGVDVLRYEA
ncbi:MAG: PIN domain-containing protein [Holophagaceae bacterium]|nr:PIN domain-containing protein [Holophagaceae bacterium]